MKCGDCSNEAVSGHYHCLKCKDKKRAYYLAHRDKVLAKAKQRQYNNKETIHLYQHEYYKANKTGLIKYRTEWHQNLKYEVHSHYSNGNPQCAHCGFSDIRALSLDHVVAVGGASKRSGCMLAAKLKREGYPPGYQVLCMNCQFIKRVIEKECLPNGSYSTKPNSIATRKYKANIKAQVYTHYCNGIPRCNRCGNTDMRTLSIDHINGDGFEHRKTCRAARNICQHLKKRQLPEGYQVLCMSCQWIKRFENNEHCKQ